MVAVSVTADVKRVDDAEDIGGVASRGGGAGAAAEAPLAYQGSNAWNRKGTSSTGSGFEYQPTNDVKTTDDMTATDRRHWMVKHSVSDFPGLRANDGLRVYIGDGTSEYAYITAGTDAIKAAYSEYLLRTATIIIPVSPNVVGYRDATHSSGTPTLTSVDLYAIEAEFASSSAKSENIALDAVDIGAGLDLVGGDGADPDGNWSDFVDADEGTDTNRWGFASSIYSTDGVMFFFGRLRVGGASATEFTGTGRCLWPDGLFEAGFSGPTFDLQNASTVTSDAASHTSLGTTNVEDTRADYTVTGTAGAHTITGTLNNFRNVTLTSAVTVTGGNLEFADLTQGGATLTGATLRVNSASGVAACDDFTVDDTTDLTVIQAGSGHFADYGTIAADQSISWTVKTQGFPVGTTGSPATTTSVGDETILVSVNSGITFTINVVGGATIPSVKNDGSGDVNIVQPQNTATIKGWISGAILVIYDDDAADPQELGTELARNNNITTDEVFNFANAKIGDDIVITMYGATGYKSIQQTETLQAGNSVITLIPQLETN